MTKKLVTAAFKLGNMVPIDKNLIHFSRNALCVYVKSLEALLVFDSSSTVSAMGFKDLFKKEGTKHTLGRVDSSERTR